MDYPWYDVVRGFDLEQGDIFEECPVLLPRTDFDPIGPDTLLFDEEVRDIIILSQTCDLVVGREKVTEVLLCPLWPQSQFSASHYLASAKGMEDARRGILPAFHLIAACRDRRFEREIRVV